ncbi:Signal recognition particle subunit SRP72 [Coemansia guatemalensis]|uniref:Signal recognition particle subunit SRP72 n=1 Tax=Coemansia guatemalensis TaxID=2761395 RepID=A0A9W8LT17_9FUNG|nr:Signal recognition particle subunit SRP72 [Coemansia guatemalensis]
MTTPTLESYFSKIRDALAEQNLRQVVDSSQAGLRDYPMDSELAKIEIVALIKTEKAALALEAIGKARAAKILPPRAMEYEAAYCHFALKQYAEAKILLEKLETGPATKRLQAQVAYKSGKFAKCIEIYESLLSSSELGDSERDELRLNLAAAKAAAAQAGGRAQGTNKIPDDATEDYELMFNVATRQLAEDKAQEAVELLEAAAERANAVLTTEGWADQDIQDEVGPIEAQRAVAFQTLGKTEVASAIYVKLASRSTLDHATRAIVLHNLAMLGAQKGPVSFKAAAEIKRALQGSRAYPGILNRQQCARMAYNMAAIQFLQQQCTAARRSLAELGKSHSDCALSGAGLLSASISLKLHDPSKALNELAALSHTHAADAGVLATLAAAQVAVSLGDAERAAKILSTWRDKADAVSLDALSCSPEKFIRYYFGICQLIHWLAPQSASDPVIGDAAGHLYSEVCKLSSPTAALLAAVGDCLTYAGNMEKAYKCFSEAKSKASASGLSIDTLGSEFMAAVLLIDGDETQSTAQLLKGYGRRRQALKRIPGIPPRVARRFWPRFGASSKDRSAKKATTPAALAGGRLLQHQARRQRKLAKAPPKNYAPDRSPDSERWIPLRQRSYYRPRGRGHQQQKQRGGAQGGAAEAGWGLGSTGSARIAGREEGATAAAVTTSDAHASNSRDDADATSTPASASKARQKSSGGRGKSKPKPRSKRNAW